MPLYERHVFVCENRRGKSDPKGRCAAKGGGGIRARMKEAGCLGQCAHGAVVAVYPEAVRYGDVRHDDVERIVREHLVLGRPVESLRLSGIQ